MRKITYWKIIVGALLIYGAFSEYLHVAQSVQQGKMSSPAPILPVFIAFLLLGGYLIWSGYTGKSLKR